MLVGRGRECKAVSLLPVSIYMLGMQCSSRESLCTMDEDGLRTFGTGFPDFCTTDAKVSQIESGVARVLLSVFLDV